ncbi:MAG: hypothetical protein Q8876_09980, partial [Bacillota bacterium]|nr:hypothetical protein [Bacillota bacterium]
MLCKKCGTVVRERDEICHVCGAQISGNDVPSRQTILERENNNQYRLKQYPKKRNIRALWISIAGFLVAAAVTTILFIYPGILTAKKIVTARESILSGKTVQERFLLENSNVIKKAFEGFGSDKTEKLTNEPFDMSLDITATEGSFSQSSNINIAYDNKTMGMKIQSKGESINEKLLKNILYIQQKNSVIGLEFNTDSDLQQPMSIVERFVALEGDSNKYSKTNIENYGEIANILLNDIDEKSYTENNTEKILTLNSNDIINILQKFSDTLKDNKKYKASIDGYLKNIGISKDSIVLIDEAINNLKTSDKPVEFIWKVSYKEGSPASISITYGDQLNLMFAYDDIGSASDISFTFKIGTKMNLTGDIKYKKTQDGIDYNGNFTSAGNSAIFVGNNKWTGDKMHGILDITINGQMLKLEYDELFKFGMPLIAVNDDERFNINTQKANIINISDIPIGYGAQSY